MQSTAFSCSTKVHVCLSPQSSCRAGQSTKAAPPHCAAALPHESGPSPVSVDGDWGHSACTVVCLRTYQPVHNSKRFHWLKALEASDGAASAELWPAGDPKTIPERVPVD